DFLVIDSVCLDLFFPGLIFSVCFFFSSRRRHTRWPRDWSSDVCSSDLIRKHFDNAPPLVFEPLPQDDPKRRCPDITKAKRVLKRSEERRVGKECRCRW